MGTLNQNKPATAQVSTCAANHSRDMIHRNIFRYNKFKYYYYNHNSRPFVSSRLYLQRECIFIIICSKREKMANY